MQWEVLEKRDHEITERHSIPSGWIVRTIVNNEKAYGGPAVSMTVVDDPDHKWDPKAKN